MKENKQLTEQELDEISGGPNRRVSDQFVNCPDIPYKCYTNGNVTVHKLVWMSAIPKFRNSMGVS